MEEAKLVERLRRAATEMRTEDQPGWPIICDDAADTIERLSSERDAEREACAQLVESIAAAWYAKPPIPSMAGEWPKELARAIRARSDALRGEGQG